MIVTKYLVTSLTVLVGMTVAFTDECDYSCDASLAQDCLQAVEHFEINHIYEKTTSKSSKHCMATFQCDIMPYPRTEGRVIRALFKRINSSSKCNSCGTYAFHNGDCAVSYRYCDGSNCVEQE